MTTDFQKLVMQVVREKGIGIFDKVGQCQEILQQYAKNNYKREIRLFLISLEAGCHQELFKAAEPEEIKPKLMQKLQDEYGITPAYAEETITLLGHILKEREQTEDEKVVQLETAAQKGDYRAQYELGLLFAKLKRYEASIHWLKTVAQEGLALYEQSLKKSSQMYAEKKQTPADSFVYIKGGSFIMGSPLSDPDRDASESQHHVKVSGFHLSKYQVTQGEYEAVMGINPSAFKGDDLPVEYISWYDAIAYCNKRSEQEGLVPAYTINKSKNDPSNNNEFDSQKWLIGWNQDANGYRLPTEAEWEYACRAGTNTAYYTGPRITMTQANYNGDISNTSKGSTRPVGSFAPNPWGIFDMHGNLWEWCWDWYGNYNVGVSQTDPLGAALGTQRVLRGGSWSRKAHQIRSAARIGSTPSLRSGDFGFRLAHSE